MKHILYICHDARFHGAQLLSLAIVTHLSRRLGFSVTTVLLDEGELIPRFEEVSTVVNFWKLSAEEQDVLLATCRRKTSMCIANTVVSGRILPQLKAHSYRVVSLIHELPTLIRAYKLESVVDAIASQADVVVFPSSYVSERFETFSRVLHALKIRPQGLYTELQVESDCSLPQLKAQMGIPYDAKVVLGVGFADFRKGVDLFIQVAALAAKSNPALHFIWLGRLHQDLSEWLAHDIELAGLMGRVHLVGQKTNVSPYYQLADLMLMTSREDPFPSTVMEAISAGAYVVGFENAGGFVDLMTQGCGELVPYLDIHAMAKAVGHALASHCDQERRQGRMALSEEKFSFDSYVIDLIRYATPEIGVSVVVPNFNYGSLIYDRLKSIALQDYPPLEIIVLDDCSIDQSRSEIERFVADFGECIAIRTVFSDSNSGSVFAQWKKGLEQVAGELVWIAEADDVAAPNFLSSLVPYFADTKMSLAFSQSRQINGEGIEIAPDYLEYVSSVDPEHWNQDYINDGDDEIRRFMAIKNTIPNVSAVLFRRPPDLGFMSRVMEYRVAGDWVFYLELLRQGKLAFCARSLNGHRRHAGSQTSQLAAQQHFNEIVEVQNWVDRTFDGDANMRARCLEYREFLRRYFGLPEAVGSS